MKKWIKEKRNILIGSLLIGLVVGFSVNFYEISRPVHAQGKSDVLYQKSEVLYPITKSGVALDDISYWRGKVDSKLESIDKKVDEFCVQIEKLNSNLVEIKVSAAKDGTIYGGITSLIVIISSLLGQSLLKSRKKV